MEEDRWRSRNIDPLNSCEFKGSIDGYDGNVEGQVFRTVTYSAWVSRLVTWHDYCYHFGLLTLQTADLQLSMLQKQSSRRPKPRLLVWHLFSLENTSAVLNYTE